MKSVLVYADGSTEERDTSGAQWFIASQKVGPERYFWGFEVSYASTKRNGQPDGGVIVYVERPKAVYSALFGA